MGKQGNQHCKNQKPTKQRKKPMKITYISSPTMVKATNPSEFRAIVQELTGKDSKVVGDFSDSYCTYSDKELASGRDHNVEDQFHSCVELEYDDNSFTNVNDGANSVSLEIDQSGNFLWRDVSDSFFGHQTTFVFV